MFEDVRRHVPMKRYLASITVHSFQTSIVEDKPGHLFLKVQLCVLVLVLNLPIWS
jgi:hypothetical protein